MGHRTQVSKRPAPKDAGTLWSMRRGGLAARCALLAWSTRWELRVLVDGAALLSERCDGPEKAFQLAERWKRRLSERHWQQILPPRSRGPANLV
jgi:hypothetical protein